MSTVNDDPSPSRTPDEEVEEDVSGARRWSEEEAAEAAHLQPSSKGKGRATYPDVESYPPTTDEEAETRRIEENLRRWELAERAKRKAARVSVVASTGADQSMLSSMVGSILRRTPRPNDQPSRGTHTVLSSQDETHDDDDSNVVPLDDIAATPTPSPTHSEPGNPFSDEHAELANESTPQRPAMLKASSSIRRPPTPKPLDLPPPKAAPPTVAPPPEPVVEESEHKETRWWHEWLCGFGEGEDRGGENQSGRTNPFE
ncbi:hypothetical protein HMN09_01048500 [Mycena chlorophos]|uniref:Uncharacterized protein n=1 Tax=Mycena chlorophos TaxID=658473 RepID=A0A8H6W1J8_MYCCL|nr:hypothetical protein HMN09_01048500 [Mycena chlorophos]